MTPSNALRQSMRRSPPAVALTLCLAFLGHAAAQDLQSRAVASAYGGDEEATWSAIEVTTMRGRLLPPAAPFAGQEGRTTDELAGLNYRVWMTRGRAVVRLRDSLNVCMTSAK